MSSVTSPAANSPGTEVAPTEDALQVPFAGDHVKDAPNADPETRTQTPTRAATPSHPAKTNTTQSTPQRIGDFRLKPP